MDDVAGWPKLVANLGQREACEPPVSCEPIPAPHLLIPVSWHLNFAASRSNNPPTSRIYTIDHIRAKSRCLSAT
jgi:hypothetical protein